MYVDSELGALTFRTVFQKAKELVKKAAPIVAAQAAPKPSPESNIVGTLPPLDTAPAPSRPGWIMPAALIGGSVLAFKFLKGKGRGRR
jgi:hypothetical protein